MSPAQAAAALGQFRLDFAQDYRIAEITIGLLQRAAVLADTHTLRGYDAVQLASALSVPGSVDFWTADRPLGDAARAEGLRSTLPH